MKDLTTRKIVLGMLMTLVLALGVQGIADAIDTFSPGFDPGDLSNIVEGDSITVNSFPTAANLANVREYVSLDVRGGGANFPNPTDNSRTVNSYTWRETDSDSSDGTNHNEAAFPTIGSQTITVNSPGEVTVTVKYTETYDSTKSRTTSFVKTYYVVRDRLDVNLSHAISLRGVTNGVGYPYDHRQDIQIYVGDNNHNEVTYTFVSGSLYIKEGNRYKALSTEDATSSRAEVWLSMGTRGVTNGALNARPTSGTTNTVTAEVTGNGNETTGLYIYGRPQLSDLPTLGSTLTAGRPGLKVSPAITVIVTDETSSNAPVPNVPVTFKVANTTLQGGLLSYPTGTPPEERIDANNKVLKSPPAAASTLHVRTNSSGEAIVDFEFGSVGGEQEITVTAVGMTKTVKALDTTTSTRDISIKSEKQSSSNEYDLYATVTDNEIETAGVSVTFTAISGGELTNTPSTGAAASGDSVSELTNSVGIAQVIYDPLGASGTLQISVSLPETGTVPTSGVKTLRRTFNVRGGSSGQDQQEDQQQTNTITISLSSITGAPGETVTITISNPVGVAVSLSSPNSGFPESNFSPATGSATSFTSTVTLPSTDGTYTIFAVGTIGGTTVSDTATVTVETTALGTLTVSKDGAQIGTQQQILVRASPAPSSNLPFTVTSGRFRVGGGDITTAGTGRAVISVPTASGLYTLTVSAEGYNPRQVTFTAGTQTTDTTDTTTDPTIPTEEPPAAEPSSIQISGPAARTGTVNQELDSPLLVRVLDDVGNGVADARVIFRVISGRGRLSQRGNGRAIGVQTDSRGFARANFTPLDGGTITVRASTTDISATVTFTITSDDGTPVDDGPADTGEPQSTERTPVVHVGAASRPPMLWVEEGAIYALVGANVQRFASGVDNAMNLTVAGGKVYWTEMTGESSGTINSANLDGSDVTELKAIRSVPIGIAVDTAGRKLYWTASSGKIKRANLDGSSPENVMQNLSDPMDIGLAGGNAYWTEGTGSVRFVNLKGQKVVRDISTGPGIPGSLAIGGGKVYWTEKTGERGGTINSANLNGSGVKQLASPMSVPMGIAVDTARSRVYWTSSSGKVKSANLNGGNQQKVVDGLGSPGELVLSNSIAAPAATPTTTTTTAASRSKYDVNRDGTVDNTDASLVAAAMNTSNTRYDVNGDGTVNFLDLLLVFDNRDPGAAGAPTLVGMQLSAAQIDHIEEQIDLLIATNDRSPAALRVLVYLQQLLVTARPEKTQLLANYPNPFNPETWIPYELATDTHVRLTIYNTQGVVIRTLEFGQQSAGYYVGRDRAAYWDGRNALGEQVASGLYFYQLETDEMSSMRKMVILK